MKMTGRASEDITERSMTELSGITYGSDGPGITASDPLRPVLEELPEHPVSGTNFPPQYLVLHGETDKSAKHPHGYSLPRMNSFV